MKYIRHGLFFLLFPLLCNCVSTDATVGKQVTGLQAFHRSGQTFIVWNGIENYGEPLPEGKVPGGLLQAEFKKKYEALKKAEKNGRKLTYRIYRSDKPINSNTIKSAELIAEAQPLSVYYPYHLGMYWYEDSFSKSIVPRLAVEPGNSLEDGQEVYVHTVKKTGKSYYAVVASINGKSNFLISESNSIKEPVIEQTADPEPVLQRIQKLDKKQHYMYQFGPAEIRYYMQWVGEPYSNMPRGYEWAVVIPDSYNRNKPAVLQLSLHGWGATLDGGTYWYDVKPSTIRISTVNYTPQDWWYGYRKTLGRAKLSKDDVVYNYTELRLMHFINWVKKNWQIDDNLVFIEGQSMGGAGAMSFGMKNGDVFSYANSWVGIGSWRNSTYFRKGESDKWGDIDELTNYNAVKFDDWMDLSWWLRKYPQTDTPFLSFANGKNDGQIGWLQAVITVKALQETKRPFVFLWGMQGHGQRAKFMMDSEIMALNKSIPAFRNCLLDDNIGTGSKMNTPQKFTSREGKVLDDWYDGDSAGQINAYLMWGGVREEEKEYEITVFLTKEAPKDTCTVDITSRRTQKFKAKHGEKFRWVNVDLRSNKEIQSGEVIADKWGLITIEGLRINKIKNRIKIWR